MISRSSILQELSMAQDNQLCLVQGGWRILIVSILVFIISPVWADDGAGKKEIRIYIERQILIALENGQEVYNFDIVTGRDGKETTAGSYRIFRKHEKYTSNTYGSEMPYAMFFTEDGKAIHGTQMATLRSYLHSYITESVGSQGCVGLTDDNALALFQWAPMGTPVIVISEKVADENSSEQS
jgi:lipoprotein-anchoring transpeptidase ErfK/SrfK